MASQVCQYDFYVISDNVEWENSTILELRKRREGIRCISRNVWIPGRFQLENLVKPVGTTKIVVVGFTSPSSSSSSSTDIPNFLAQTVFQEMLLNKNIKHRKLIPVRITEDAEIPTCLNVIAPAYDWKDNVYEKLLHVLDGANIELNVCQKPAGDQKYSDAHARVVQRVIQLSKNMDDEMLEKLTDFLSKMEIEMQFGKNGSLIFYLSVCNPKALTNLWKMHVSGQLIKKLADILIPEKLRRVFLDNWMTEIDEAEYKSALDKFNEKGFTGSQHKSFIVEGDREASHRGITRRSSINYGFGLIPKTRGTLAEWTADIFIVIFALYYAWEVNSKHMYQYFFDLLIMLWGAIIGKFIQCFCRFVEELRHIDSRHSNSYWQTIKSCFQVFFTKAFAGGAGMMVIAMYFMWFVCEVLFDHQVDHTLYWQMFISSVGVSLITNYMLGFKTLSEVERSEVQESKNTNVAQGLAWSYFTGYLRIILPKLEETISRDPRWGKEMEAENLPCKLFAIVPLNCKIPARLGEDEVKHKGITFESKLPALFVDRGGVKYRPYISSVYKIQDDHGHQYHAICEYVTIVDTLHQMPFFDAIDEKKREEQCRLLVRILEELIYMDETCRHKCKIVVLSGEDRPLLRDVLIDKICESKMDILLL